ncbi:MAG: glycosyltransferase [Candidatus Omnitrophica bacterium]|nr:glycosyltransferase [Candidatus Omnitrophota bacterium]
MPKIPEISVIMSVYNGQKHLKKSVDSILNQTFNDFEFITINDGSTDETRKIFESYKDERLRIVHLDKNIGIPKAKNMALKMAKGRYVAIADADDIYLPDRLKKQRDFLENNPDVGLVASAHYIIDENDNVVGRRSYIGADRIFRKKLIIGNIFCHSTVMLRKEVFDKVGLYDEAWEISLDYEFYFRVVKYYKLAALKDFLVYYRITPTGISSTMNRKQRLYAIKAQIKAIKERQYGFGSYFYVLYSALHMLSPKALQDALSFLVKNVKKIVKIGF